MGDGLVSKFAAYPGTSRQGFPIPAFQETGQESGGNVSGIAPGRKQNFPDQGLRIPGGISKNAQGHDQIPSGIAVGNRINVDPVKNIGPGHDPFITCGKSLPKTYLP